MKNKHKSGQLIKDVPLALIGFMGKQDGSRKGIGAALLVDAARRAHRNIDIPAWGLVLDCEGGQQNEKLWNWYRAAGFIPSKSNAGRMYAPYENLIPELAPLR
jgi:GNAT superfamily N-acetyltransferase